MLREKRVVALVSFICLRKKNSTLAFDSRMIRNFILIVSHFLSKSDGNAVLECRTVHYSVKAINMKFVGSYRVAKVTVDDSFESFIFLT